MRLSNLFLMILVFPIRVVDPFEIMSRYLFVNFPVV